MNSEPRVSRLDDQVLAERAAARALAHQARTDLRRRRRVARKELRAQIWMLLGFGCALLAAVYWVDSYGI
jgi:type VI protein secretion system component VasF